MASVRHDYGFGDAACVCLVGAASEAYARHLTVSLYSALAKLPPDRSAKVFVIDGGMGAKTRRRVMRCLTVSHPSAQVQIISPDLDRLDGLPVSARHPAAVYLQLMIPKLLPPEVKRVLYLDSDVVVTEDVSPLFAMDMKGRALWAVRDDIDDAELTRLRHDFPDVAFRRGAEYINTGVLLMDLSAWRREQIAERALAILREHGHLCIWQNQDAINVALAGDWGKLADKWNNRLRGSRHVFPHLERSVGGDGILHFCGPRKPWLGWCHRDVAYHAALLDSGWLRPAEAMVYRLGQPLRRARSRYFALRHRIAMRKKLARLLRRWQVERAA